MIQRHAVRVNLVTIVRIASTRDATFALPRSINSPW